MRALISSIELTLRLRLQAHVGDLTRFWFFQRAYQLKHNFRFSQLRRRIPNKVVQQGCVNELYQQENDGILVTDKTVGDAPAKRKRTIMTDMKESPFDLRGTETA
jgi:hypothetical protein